MCGKIIVVPNRNHAKYSKINGNIIYFRFNILILGSKIHSSKAFFKKE